MKDEPEKGHVVLRAYVSLLIAVVAVLTCGSTSGQQSTDAVRKLGNHPEVVVRTEPLEEAFRESAVGWSRFPFVLRAGVAFQLAELVEDEGFVRGVRTEGESLEPMNAVSYRAGWALAQILGLPLESVCEQRKAGEKGKARIDTDTARMLVRAYANGMIAAKLDPKQEAASYSFDPDTTAQLQRIRQEPQRDYAARDLLLRSIFEIDPIGLSATDLFEKVPPDERTDTTATYKLGDGFRSTHITFHLGTDDQIIGIEVR